MGRQMKCLRLLLTGALVLVAALSGCGRSVARAPGGAQGWGQEPLKASERAYYVDRVNRILDAWRGMTRQAQRTNVAPTGGPPYICLVVDTDKKELWVESDGCILPEYHSDLPAGMDWSLYQVARGESTPLPPLSRFRIPDVSARSDQAFLLGRNQAMHIFFSFNSGGRSSSYGGIGAGDAVRSGASASPLAKTTLENTYVSLVVRPDDYEKAKANFPSVPVSLEPVALTQNKIAWLRVEKPLYQEVERQVGRHGWQLLDLKIECGPDYTAATAQVQGVRQGPLLSAKSHSARTELRIDSLGNDVWYARSVPSPASSRSAHLDLEFVVGADGTIPEPDQAAWLQEGRGKQQEMPVPPASPWQAKLPNGATIELVGLCENPSAGRPWWGPDGSPLGYAPYCTRATPSVPRDRAAYDMIWRVDPPQEGGLQIPSAPAGFWLPYPAQMRDRYGNAADMGLEIGGYVFDRSQDKTTLEFVVRNARSEPAAVTFKNISLVRGKNQGFEIEAAK